MTKTAEELILELTAPEGSMWRDFCVNRWGDESGLISYYGNADKRKNSTLQMYVKVIGFSDEIAPFRAWGYIGIGGYKEKDRVVVKTKNVINFKKPETWIEKVLSSFGFYKKI